MNSGDYLVELRKNTGMNRREFCEYFEIPYRTVTDWELGHRKMPDYLLRLITYKAKMENLTKEGNQKNE
ncbi:MAG: transcriptional regulator [Lachnospiraceae bacterium]|nr:transcriptional regulator [Lachnospiraceae bacterium]